MTDSDGENTLEGTERVGRVKTEGQSVTVQGSASHRIGGMPNTGKGGGLPGLSLGPFSTKENLPASDMLSPPQSTSRKASKSCAQRGAAMTPNCVVP